MALFDKSDTFTPIVKGASTDGAGTYTTQTGKYTRDNDVINFEITLAWTAHTGTGGLEIDGLPYTQGSTKVSYSIVAENLTFTNQLACMSKPSTTKLALYSMASGASATAVAIDTAVTSLIISGSYKLWA